MMLQAAYTASPGDASRNSTDRQLGAIRDSEGMVGVTFAGAFLREYGAESQNNEAGYDEAALEMVAHGNWLRILRATWQRFRNQEAGSE